MINKRIHIQVLASKANHHKKNKRQIHSLLLGFCYNLLHIGFWIKLYFIIVTLYYKYFRIVSYLMNVSH